MNDFNVEPNSPIEGEIQNPGVAPVREMAPITLAPNFAPADLEHLARFANWKAPDTFQGVAVGLIRFAQEPGQYGYGDTVGHFEFCDFDKSAVENRALLRMCRVALDFLDANELACEAANVNELRSYITGFEAAQGKTPTPCAPIETPTVAPADESETEPATWPEIAKALRDLAHFADAIEKGAIADYTGEVGETRELCEALELGRAGVGFLRLEFREELARATEWRRKDVEAFAALEIE